MQPTILSVARYMYQSAHYAAEHSHAAYEIVIYVSGCGQTVIGGNELNFSRHSVAFIPPQTPHSEHYAQAGGELYCVCFTLDACPYFHPPVTELPDPVEMHRCAAALYAEYRFQKPLYLQKGRLILSYMITDLVRRTMMPPQMKDELH